jgi:hypothetical protein
MLKPIFTTVQAASKNDNYFKGGHNRLENNHLSTLIKIGETSIPQLFADFGFYHER